MTVLKSNTAISGVGAVSSVFGRTGAVVAVSGDYTVSQVTGAAPIASPTFTGTVKGISIPFSYAISDETTALTTGTKMTFRIPYACTLTDIRASLTTASSSGLPTFNVTKNGSTIFTTKLTIDANETTSVTAATPYVFNASPLNFADDDVVTIAIDVAGTAAAGAKITMYLTRI